MFTCHIFNIWHLDIASINEWIWDISQHFKVWSWIIPSTKIWKMYIYLIIFKTCLSEIVSINHWFSEICQVNFDLWPLVVTSIKVWNLSFFPENCKSWPLVMTSINHWICGIYLETFKSWLLDTVLINLFKVLLSHGDERMNVACGFRDGFWWVTVHTPFQAQMKIYTSRMVVHCLEDHPI